MQVSKKILQVLNGQKIWPPPIWLMRQAGRFLPEFRELRQQADFLTRCLTPDLAVEITLQPIRRFGFDAAILFSDILILPWAMGQNLEFIEGKGPVLPPIRNEEDLKQLTPENIQQKIEPILTSVRILNKLINSEQSIGLAKAKSVSLIGFAGSPFTVACYMVEGGSSRDFSNVFKMIYQNPALFQKIIDLLVTTTADYLCQQIEAGAEVIMLFDSWAGILSPNLFRQFVLLPTQEIVRRIREQFHDFPIIGFPRLAGTKIFSYAKETNLNVIGLDQTEDISVIDSSIDKNIGFQGNLDPFYLLNGGNYMAQNAASICQKLRHRPHIFNLGHGVLPTTPVEHVYELVEYVRNLKD